MAAAKESSIGSISAEWKAWLTTSRLVSRPWPAQCSATWATRSSGPETTVLPGVLSVAMLTGSGRVAASSAASAWIAAIAPPAGSLPMAVARAATSVQASGRSSTPATCAAAISPTEWPMTARGAGPMVASSRANATWSAKSPVCA